MLSSDCYAAGMYTQSWYSRIELAENMQVLVEKGWHRAVYGGKAYRHTTPYRL